MYEKGELGKIQFMQASHPQDMDGWPEYWERMIPMHYATHVVSPVLGLVKGRAECVSCFGSGTINERLAKKSGNPFAVESCHIKIKDSDIAAHIWRFLFDTARQYRESFDVYGTKKSFEWALVEGEEHVLHTAKRPEPEIPERVKVPDYAHLLPPEIQAFTRTIQDAGHLSFVQGGGHGGSHPHLANEFLRALRDHRDPWPNAVTSANWTCVGICAHESAKQGGRSCVCPILHWPEKKVVRRPRLSIMRNVRTQPAVPTRAVVGRRLPKPPGRVVSIWLPNSARNRPTTCLTPRSGTEDADCTRLSTANANLLNLTQDACFQMVFDARSRPK